MATLFLLGGTTEARQEQEEEEGTDGAPEATVGSPTPLSLGGTAEGDSEGDLTPLPSAQTSSRAASSVPSRSARTTGTRQPPPPVPSSTGGPTADSFSELIFGWEMMSLRSWWVVDKLRDELSPEGRVSAERVADLFRLWLSATEGLAALLGPGQAALRESLLGVQRAGRAWSTAIVPSAPAAVAPAPEPGAATQPLERTDTVDRQAAELLAQPPPLEPLREGDSPSPLPLPPPHLSPPHALGLDGLASGSASSTGNSGGANRGGSSSVEVLEAGIPAAKRRRPPPGM
ncbi:hypothetical protein ACSSS7_001033 [Eimeria intestinalis]